MPSRIARNVALLAHALLIVGLTWKVGLSVGLVLLLPLLAALPGLWRGQPYTYAWASMLLVFYCAGLLTEAYMRPSQAMHFRLLAIVAALEFVSLVLFVRLRAAEVRVAAAAARSAARTAA